MTLYELWNVAPQSKVCVRQENGALVEYTGGYALSDKEVVFVKATAYPMCRSVLEVKLANQAI